MQAPSPARSAVQRNSVQRGPVQRRTPLRFADFPPHLRLLLLTANPRPAPAQAEQARMLAAGPLDWTRFLAAVQTHRVGALVLEGLQSLQIADLSAPLFAPLQQHSRRNSLRALRTAAEMHRIAQSFASAGLELTALKGIALSQLLYGNPAARNVGDIDLLTQPTRLPEQIDLLAGLGYERINPAARLTPRRIASYVRFWKDFTFRNAHARVDLDLHWRGFNHRLHPANHLIAEAAFTTTEVFGLPVRTLSPRDSFCYVAAHGVSDVFTYFKSLADVAGFLRLFTQAELDDALLHAQRFGLLAQVSAAVHLANTWMQTDARSPHLLGPADPLARSLYARASTLLIEQDFEPNRDFVSPARWLALELRLVPGLPALVEAVRRIASRPRVWAAVDLPDRLFWLYPLLGLLLPPRRQSIGQSQAAPRTPLESPNAAGTMGVAKSPPKT